MSDSSSDTEEKFVSPRDAAIASLGRDFSSYTSDANFCIYFKLVTGRAEVEEDLKGETFYPDYVHQFFVEQERIFGYKKPVIRLFYTASRLKRYVNFTYEDKLNKETDGIAPDDIMQALGPVLEDMEFTEDLNRFIKEAESKEERQFRPPGELLSSFEREYKKPKMISRAQLDQMNSGSASDQGIPSKVDTTNSHETPVTESKYEIYRANVKTKGFENFQARMQSLIMWFIESATMVDFQDSHWDFFMLFKKINKATENDPAATSITSEDQYLFCGYASVYRYYAYPDRTRPRVSQMLLLPPFRRNGLGTSLLQAIYDYYKKQPATLDITAEDPDEEFISMRDFLDCKNALEIPCFQPESLKKGWSDEIAKEAQEKLKLCQRQARKVYEILKLKCTNTSDEEAIKNYRIEIKNRLNIPFQRLKMDCDKVEKRGYELPEEMKLQRDNVKLALAQLDENYHELIKQYQHTIDKLQGVTMVQ